MGGLSWLRSLPWMAFCLACFLANLLPFLPVSGATPALLAPRGVAAIGAAAIGAAAIGTAEIGALEMERETGANCC